MVDTDYYNVVQIWIGYGRLITNDSNIFCVDIDHGDSNVIMYTDSEKDARELSNGIAELIRNHTKLKVDIIKDY